LKTRRKPANRLMETVGKRDERGRNKQHTMRKLNL